MLEDTNKASSSRRQKWMDGSGKNKKKSQSEIKKNCLVPWLHSKATRE